MCSIVVLPNVSRVLVVDSPLLYVVFNFSIETDYSTPVNLTTKK